jgi:hypothetical protein
MTPAASDSLFLRGLVWCAEKDADTGEAAEETRTEEPTPAVEAAHVVLAVEETNPELSPTTGMSDPEQQQLVAHEDEPPTEKHDDDDDEKRDEEKEDEEKNEPNMDVGNDDENGEETHEGGAGKQCNGACASRILLRAKFGMKRLFSIIDTATRWEGVVAALKWVLGKCGEVNTFLEKRLHKMLDALLYFLVVLPVLFVVCAMVVLLWMPLWSVRHWIRVIYRLPFGASHLVAVVVQLLMTDKALDLFYTVALVVFHYGDEFTDAITITGWWGCDFDSTAMCDVKNQEKGFAIAGTVA